MLLLISLCLCLMTTLPLQANVISSDFQLYKLAIHEKADVEAVLALSSKSWLPVKGHELEIGAGQSWYALDKDGEISKTQSRYLVIENNLSVSQLTVFHQPYKNQTLSIPMNNYGSFTAAKVMLQPGLDNKIYFRLNTLSKTHVSLKLLTAKEFANKVSHDQFNYGLAIGGIVMLALVLFFLFTANKDRFVLILSGYFAAQAILLAVILGNNFYKFFPTLPELRGVEFAFLGTLSSLFLLWFSAGLFRLKYVNPNLNRAFKILGFTLLLYLPLSLILTLEHNLIVARILDFIVIALLLCFGVILIQQQQRLAVLFTIIISIQFVFSLLNSIYGVWYPLHASVYIIAFWTNCLAISFLLSRQYYYQIKDKHIAQRQAIENELLSRQTQEELLSVQKANQEELEVRVQERTIELNIALQELEEANQELEEKNTKDELTGLYNRRHYDQKVMAEYRRSRRNLTPLSLVIIDIDHFKQVNDTYGHLMGDHCLAQLGKLINKCLRRSTDVGCRYGGEEFCLILPETDSAGAISIAEELRLAVIAHHFEHQDVVINLTISCGISVYQQQKDWLPAQLFDAADKALYKAKDAGRNQVCLAKATKDTNIQEL